MIRVTIGIRRHAPRPIYRKYRFCSTLQSARARGTVYFIATPIGHMSDITFRAVELLKHVDILFAEDTRHTIKLLRHLEIFKPQLSSYHDHNYRAIIPRIIEMARSGKDIGVVSDAGTPGISDPGAELVEACAENGIDVVPIPGPSALTTALSISGFRASPCTFMGFLPHKGPDRIKQMKQMATCNHTVVFFEAPHRVLRTMQELVDLTGPASTRRQCSCCRELTKLHEEVWRGSLNDSVTWLQSGPGRGCDAASEDSSRIRGEFTVVLSPQEPSESSYSTTAQECSSLLLRLRDDGLGRSDAVRVVADMADGAVKKSAIYKIALGLSWQAK